MSLTPGYRLGPYVITAPIGAGGMGEVYRANDPRLGREVAIKVLPASFAADADRLRRFEQEARAAGVLNHPNVTAVYDIGADDSGAPYVVSELLEGETLRAALAGGKLSARRAVDYAIQIAHGLAAAHEKGIIHRDLKPENLFVTADGRVKILDFGLAKLTETLHPSASGLTNTPTASAGTEPGVVLGTIGYMSPEQVRGRPADAQSDIFSFGAILYEMLSGQRAFRGDSAADTMSAILKEEPPDLSLTNQNLAPGLERVIRHCLEKSPKQRFHSAHDLAFDLEALSGVSDSRAPAGQRSSIRGGLAWLAAAAVLGAGVVAFLAGRASAPRGDPPVVRSITYSGNDSQPSASPDGRTIAFTSGRGGTSRIWIKQLAGGGEAALTRGPTDASPRFSPDGSSILFARGELGSEAIYRIPALGGEPRKILSNAAQADWSPDASRIVFLRSGTNGGVPNWSAWTAASDGSSERQIHEFRNVILHSPRWTPDGKAIVVSEQPGPVTEPAKFYWMSADGRDYRVIQPSVLLGELSSLAWSGERLLYGQSTYITSQVRTSPGRLLLQNPRSSRAEVLLNVPNFGLTVDILGAGRIVFDADLSRQNLREEPIAAGAPGTAARWFTRGNGSDRQPVYSPDGKWIVFASDRDGHFDLWKLSTETGSLQRLTEGAEENWDPSISADGKRLVWSSNRTGHYEIWTSDADGSGARQVTHMGSDAENPCETPDGKWILYGETKSKNPGIWRVRPDGSEASIFLPGGGIHPEVSPDGKYVIFHYVVKAAYVARMADGKVLPFSIPIHSVSGVGRSRWMPDGKSIAFEGLDDKGRNGVFVQAFSPDAADTSATRRPLAGFDPDVITETFSISPDGTRVVLSILEARRDILVAEGIRGITRRR